MFCKKCGYKVKNNETFCSFCGEKIERKVYEEYENIFEKKDENIDEFQRVNGYLNLNTKWWHHILVGCGAYLLMEFLAPIIMRIVIMLYQNSGMDFSCVVEGKQACEIIGNLQAFETYYKMSALIQTLTELLAVVIVILLFIKKIKLFFLEFKDKKTFKWFGLSFAMMYGANVVYSFVLMILKLLNISIDTNANQEAVNTIITGSPLLGFVFAVIAAPLFEEIIYRFGVFRAFTFKNKKREIVGLIVTTILFASIHMMATFTSAISVSDANALIIDWKLIGNDMLSFPSYLIGAFFITFSYYKSKNFATPVLMHMTWNFLSYIMTFAQ